MISPELGKLIVRVYPGAARPDCGRTISLEPDELIVRAELGAAGAAFAAGRSGELIVRRLSGHQIAPDDQVS